MADVDVLAAAIGQSTSVLSLAVIACLGGGSGGEGLPVISSETASTISQMRPDSTAQNTTVDAANDVNNLLEGGGGLNSTTGINNDAPFDFVGRLERIVLQQHEERGNTTTPQNNNIKIIPSSFYLLKRLQALLEEYEPVINDCLSSSIARDDHDGRKWRQRWRVFVEKAKNTDFTKGKEIEKSFPKPKNRCGDYVPPKSMFNLINNPGLNAIAVRKFWYTLTKKNQKLVKEQLNELWNFVEARSKADAKAAKSLKRKAESAAKKNARNKKRNRSKSVANTQPPSVSKLHVIYYP